MTPLSPTTIVPRRRFLGRLGAGAAAASGAALLAACGGTVAGAVSAATTTAVASANATNLASTTVAVEMASTTGTAESAADTASKALGSASSVLVSSAGAPVPSTAAPAAGRRTLTIWHIWNGAREPLIKDMAAKFTKQYPDLTVDEQVITTDLLTKITAGIAAGSPCDMGMINQQWVPSLATQSAVTPLGPLVARDKTDLSVFYESALPPGIWAGKLYVLPTSSNAASTLLYYNTGLYRGQGIQGPPTTWAELKDVAQKLNVKQGDAITQLGGVPAYGDTSQNFVEMIYLNNGKLLSDDNRKFLFNDTPGLDALTFIQGFYDTMGGWPAEAAFQKSQGTGEKNTPFFKGTQAMDIVGTWYLYEIKNDDPQLPYGIVPQPHGPQAGAKYLSPVTGTWAYGIPTGVKSIDDSWLLTQFFTLTKDAGNFKVQQLQLSPLKFTTNDPYYFQQTPLWSEVVKIVPDTVVAGPTPVDPQVGKLFETMMSDVIAKKVDPRAAMENAQKQAQALLDQWYSQHSDA